MIVHLLFRFVTTCSELVFQADVNTIEMHSKVQGWPGGGRADAQRMPGWHRARGNFAAVDRAFVGESAAGPARASQGEDVSHTLSGYLCFNSEIKRFVLIL